MDPHGTAVPAPRIAVVEAHHGRTHQRRCTDNETHTRSRSMRTTTVATRTRVTGRRRLPASHHVHHGADRTAHHASRAYTLAANASGPTRAPRRLAVTAARLHASSCLCIKPCTGSHRPLHHERRPTPLHHGRRPTPPHHERTVCRPPIAASYPRHITGLRAPVLGSHRCTRAQASQGHAGRRRPSAYCAKKLGRRKMKQGFACPDFFTLLYAGDSISAVHND